MKCTLCGDAGWVIDCNPKKLPLSLEVIRCPIPDCSASGKDVQIICVDALDFHRVIYHPTSGMVMSLKR